MRGLAVSLCFLLREHPRCSTCLFVAEDHGGAKSSPDNHGSNNCDSLRSSADHNPNANADLATDEYANYEPSANKCSNSASNSSSVPQDICANKFAHSGANSV